MAGSQVSSPSFQPEDGSSLTKDSEMTMRTFPGGIERMEEEHGGLHSIRQVPTPFGYATA
jgi:hypothetical protein